MTFHSNKIAAALLVTASAFATSVQAAPLFADIVAVVDESGSMSGEHAWLGSMATALNAGLQAALVGASPYVNNFGLVGFGNGFGSNNGAGNKGRQINVGGGQFGTAAQFTTATGNLVLSGSFEDGYSGIAAANGYSFRSGAARNYILVTDEDRDVTAGSPDYASVLSSLKGSLTLLNAVVNATFRCGDVRAGVLGIDGTGTGYVANGSGGYTTLSGCTTVTAEGDTKEDYVDLALASGGAAWNLNLLRAGGNSALSFTKAFVDIKVQEIITQPVPVSLPGTLALLGAGLAGLGAVRRKQGAYRL